MRSVAVATSSKDRYVAFALARADILIEKMKAIDPNVLGNVTSSSLSLSAGDRSAADAAKALVHAINKVAEDPSGEVTVESLEGLDRFNDSSVAKIQDLRRTLLNLELHYRPIVDLKTGLIPHQEALTRLADGGREAARGPAQPA